MTRSFSLLAEIAADRPLERVEPMSAPAIRGLAATIRSATATLQDTAGKLSAMVQAEADGFVQDAADVNAQLSDMRSARSDLRAALGLGGNGAPPLDDASPTPAQPAEAAPSNTPAEQAAKAPAAPAATVSPSVAAGAAVSASPPPSAPSAKQSPSFDRTAIGPIVR